MYQTIVGIHINYNEERTDIRKFEIFKVIQSGTGTQKLLWTTEFLQRNAISTGKQLAKQFNVPISLGRMKSRV